MSRAVLHHSMSAGVAQLIVRPPSVLSMIFKQRQKIVLQAAIAVLLACSLGVLIIARMYYNLAPMVINDSSPEIAAKLTDEELARVYALVRSLLFQVSLLSSILAGLWAALAGFTIWLWSRSSRKL